MFEAMEKIIENEYPHMTKMGKKAVIKLLHVSFEDAEKHPTNKGDEK